MSVLLSMTLYSSWSQNVRGNDDGKRSFYNWHLLKPEKEEREVFNQQFLRYLTCISEKTNINHEANHFTETNLSYSWGILYQLKIIINDEKISGKKHPVIHKVTYFREGSEVADLTQTPRTLRSTNLIGWGIHNIKYCSNSSHYNFFAPI